MTQPEDHDHILHHARLLFPQGRIAVHYEDGDTSRYRRGPFHL